jgi:hypothetical protein
MTEPTALAGMSRGGPETQTVEMPSPLLNSADRSPINGWRRPSCRRCFAPITVAMPSWWSRGHRFRSLPVSRAWALINTTASARILSVDRLACHMSATGVFRQSDVPERERSTYSQTLGIRPSPRSKPRCNRRMVHLAQKASVIPASMQTKGRHWQPPARESRLRRLQWKRGPAQQPRTCQYTALLTQMTQPNAVLKSAVLGAVMIKLSGCRSEDTSRGGAPALVASFAAGVRV